MLDHEKKYVKNVKIVGSEIMQPVDIQSRYQKTIQTHNAVSVPANTSSVPSTWNDTNGFDKIGITMINDAVSPSLCSLYWSNDGINIHGSEEVIATGSSNNRSPVEKPIVARYVKVVPRNADTASHIMSAWAYLKA